MFSFRKPNMTQSGLLLPVILFLSHTTNVYSAILSDEQMLQELKGRLLNAHTLIKSFIQHKAEELNLQPAATPRDLCRSTRKFIVRLLSEDPTINPFFGDNILEKKYLEQTIHLMYLAVQEKEQLTADTFKEQYDISHDELIQPDTRSLNNLYTYLSKTRLWLKPAALLDECERVFEILQKTN